MATHEITAIRTERTLEAPHEHVTRVWLEREIYGQGISPVTIVEHLANPSGDRYYVRAYGQHVTVTVLTCPYCAFESYLTTPPDHTGANHLLEVMRRF